MAEHRVSMLRSALRGHEDPARSTDPLVQAIVTKLATLEVAAPPRAHFRAELRAQLVAVAPRLIAEGEVVEDAPRHRAAGKKVGAGKETAVAKGTLTDEIRSGFRMGRPLALVACTVAILSLLLGGAFVASRRALPGDALYGVKRAAENLRMATTSGDTQRAELALDYADTRISEATALTPKSPTSTPSAHTASLISSTLGSADADVRTAAQTLGAEAVRDNSAAPLKVITAWAPGALTRLDMLINRLPAGSLRARAQQSFQLMTNMETRAKLLEAESGCSCLHSTSSDSLGPIPCPVCTSPATPGAPANSSVPTLPGVTKPTGSESSGAPASGVSGSGTGAGTVSGSGSDPSSGTSSNNPGIPLPTLPGLPSKFPTLPALPSVPLGPIGLGSCGLSAGLSPIQLQLGTCSNHLSI